jgi:ketosteroid isomerase-like protein
MKSFYLAIFFLVTLQVFSQNSRVEDEKAIRQVLSTQQSAWNNFDLEGFMQGYWKSDSLKFYGNGGVTKGWQKTLDNYKKNYPSKEYIGELNFTLKSIYPIEENSYYVMGEYHLKRSVGDAHGEFLIILKKMNGEWKIIADMSS